MLTLIFILCWNPIVYFVRVHFVSACVRRASFEINGTKFISTHSYKSLLLLRPNRMTNICIFYRTFRISMNGFLFKLNPNSIWFYAWMELTIQLYLTLAHFLGTMNLMNALATFDGDIKFVCVCDSTVGAMNQCYEWDISKRFRTFNDDSDLNQTWVISESSSQIWMK